MRNPETPGVSPDTPEIPHPETPGNNPDIPVFVGLWTSGCSVSSICDWLRFISKFQIILHTFSYHMHTYRRRR